MTKTAAAIIGAGLIIALGLLGAQLTHALIDFKRWDRVVTVKGLSEREYPADHIIWPIQFTEASNDLPALYTTLESHSDTIKGFLLEHGIDDGAITVNQPEITDKLAQQYGGNSSVQFRYSATQTITVYSANVEKVRSVMPSITSLIKQGIVFSVQQYNAQTQYVFSRLNEVKPDMIEEATVNAREVAEKFARDSQSQLGKIKHANQGQFTISARDAHHPHIKKVRVVSTIAYTLVD
ncbi:SIMPL domain-containing protein [Alteromonas sp. C1M14]|uniref:SIMPL domain-containing protein n=1 Tax=Alteromonas sp. C1M14 TaxID=2841567 RepID=UPI001C08C567|nr:SIMPL domain-containing protein [Alteromonas sp. C1M14]MBU2979386.1 SIMPL domain-containing protein [Alteromonas sp. C1M14]